MNSICFIGDRNIYLKRICNYLAGENYDVQLICRHDNGIDAGEFDKRIRIHTLKSNRLVKKIFEMYSFLKRNNPDYIHFQYLTKDTVLSLFVHHKYKIIATPWGSDLNVFSQNIFNRIIVNTGLLFCDKIQLISDGMKRKFTKQFRFINPHKLFEISWGIDYNVFHNADEKKLLYWRQRLNITNDTITILSYRNHKPLYNHHTIINSLPLIVNRFPGVKCLFTRGSYDPEYLEENKKLVLKLNLQHHVEFIEEWIRDDLLPALINLADIIVSIPFSDGLPATILEMMSTRAIPVIGNLPEYASFFKDGVNGYVLNQLEDTVQLVAILTDGIQDLSSKTLQFSELNNSYVKNHQNWELQKVKLKKLYDLP